MVARRLPAKGRSSSRKQVKRRPGRPMGSVNEATRVARAEAARSGRTLPHELLWEWAERGSMYVPTKAGAKTRKTEELTRSERIACARACASFYAHAKAPQQATDAPAPVIQVVLAAATEAALAKKTPDAIEMFLGVLKDFQASGGNLGALADKIGAAVGNPGDDGDAAAYMATLTEDMKFAGSA